MSVSNKLLAAFSASISIFAAPAVAQTTPELETAEAEDGRTAGLQDIVVVARRVSENLQKVPLSITGMDSEFVRDQRISDVRQALALVPAASFQELNKNQVYFSLRGISSQTEGAAGDPSVVVVKDEIVISRDYAKVSEVFDVERVEILRGPQGTTFGRNASGGVVHFISSKPKFRNEGEIEVEGGSQKMFGIQGYLNGKLSETLAGRFSFHFRDKDGYTKDLSSGDYLENEQNLSLRGQLLFEPNDALSMWLKAEYSNDNDGIGSRDGADCTRPYLDLGPLFYQKATCDPWELDASDDVKTYLKRQIFTATADLSYDLSDSLTLTSITGYQKADSQQVQDLFGTPFQLNINRATNNSWEATQEFRLDNSAADSRLHWLAGVFLLKDNHVRNDDRDLLVVGFVPATYQRQPSENTTKSIGVYGEVGYDITDSTTFTIGGRWSHDKKDFFVANFVTPGGFVEDVLVNPADNPVSGSAKKSWSKTTGSASLTHRFNDVFMIYALASQGYKAGGFPGEPYDQASVGIPYDPETVLNFEVGAKAQWFDNTLRTNIALYRMKVDNLQVVGFTSTNAPFITNASGERVLGAEIEFTWQPSSDMRIFGSGSVVDAKLKGSIQDGLGGQIVVEGNRPSDVPQWTATLGAEYTVDLNDSGSLSLRGDMQARSDTFTDQLEDATRRKASVAKFNAQIGWKSADRGWAASLWAKNLTNKAEITFFGPAAIVDQRPVIYAPPRTWGVSLRRSF